MGFCHLLIVSPVAIFLADLKFVQHAQADFTIELLYFPFDYHAS